MDMQLTKIKTFLHKFLQVHGRDPKNPWLLAHSLLALGKDLKLANGQLAIDRIVSGYLRSKKVGKKTIYYFPQGTQKNRIEPHPHMHLKTFLALGVPMSRTFKVNGENVTLRQIYQSALMTLPAKLGTDPGKYAWLLHALYGRLQPYHWNWVNAKGELVRFFRVLFEYFKHTDKQVSFLRVMERRGVKQIPKRGQYIYKEPCGGFHMLQSAMRWMKYPMFSKKLTPLFDAQVELIFYRFKGEMNLYVSLFKKYQKHPAYRFLILLQQLKFLGHWLETLVKLREWKLFTPSPAQRLQIRHAAKSLVLTVALLHRLGFYQRLPQLKKRVYQYYLDLLGDSAHALHALKDLEQYPIHHIYPLKKKKK